jgi:hypothetical protein
MCTQPTLSETLLRTLPSGDLTPPSVGLPQHPDEHRPEGSILLAVDQQLGERGALRIAPELADPLGAL